MWHWILAWRRWADLWIFAISKIDCSLLKCLFLRHVCPFKFLWCNLYFHNSYPFFCWDIAICSWALESFLIISQVGFNYHRKCTPCSTLIVLLFWGLEAVIYSYLPILYSYFFWLWNYDCFVNRKVFHIYAFLFLAPVCFCFCQAHCCLLWMVVAIVHHTPGVCDHMFFTSQIVLGNHLTVTEWLQKWEHFTCFARF